jgi:sugar O-acyltransferase (sialic acid O-acetyltransferase NeuD family)
MKLPLIIIGSGGHAAVVADSLLAAGEQVLGYTDADSGRHGLHVCGLPVLGFDDVLSGWSLHALALVNGIGGVRSVEARHDTQERLQSLGWRFVGVRHPSAVVSPFAKVGRGAQLLAASVVQAAANIGEACIVNTGAIVEHDVSLGAWTHVAPRALICGGVVIGALSHIGAGAVVRQGLCLGERTTVGAGAVVVKSFAGDGLLVGVPAGIAGERA